MLTIALLFFVVAAIYSTVGFGGGSSYIALLVMFDAPYEIVPVVALVCNIIVVSVGSITYMRSGHMHWPLLWPFIVTSVPAAYIGGRIPADRTVFLSVLGAVLFAAGVRMLASPRLDHTPAAELDKSVVRIRGPLTGVVIGGLSGFVGIGGGIFLAPVMHRVGWGSPKQISAVASLFILANSIAGLVGQLQKEIAWAGFQDYAMLPVVVAVGGLAGSVTGSLHLRRRQVVCITGVVVMVAAIRILIEVV